MLEADLHLMRTKPIYARFLVDTVALGQVFFPNTTFLGAFATLRKTTIGFVMSVRPSASNNSAPTGRILIKLIVEHFLKFC